MKQTNLTDEDAAAIGRALMEKLPESFMWDECPTEYVTVLRNHLFDASRELSAAAHACPRYYRAEFYERMAKAANAAESVLSTSSKP